MNLEIWCIICLEFWLLWGFFSWQKILFRYCQPVASPKTIKITPQYKGRKICKENNSTIPMLTEKYVREITLQYQGWQKNM